jgi:hypothetical protein
MTTRFILISAAAFVLSGCVASPGGQVRGPGTGCPMNFKQYCEVSGHRTESPAHCRCVRHSNINDMLDGNY